MDDLERGLRDLLTDDRLTVQVRPDAVRLVHDGIRRRRRNRAAALSASAAVVTVLAVGGAVLTSGPSGGFATVQPGGDDQPSGAPDPSGKAPAPTADDEIAWNPIAYDPSTPFALPGTTADPSVTWCDAKSVEVSASEFQGATGSAAGSVTVTNDSVQPCAVQGSPSMTGYAGAVVVATPAAVDSFLVHPWVALQPGQSAQSLVTVMGDGSRCLDPITRFRVDLGHATTPATVDAAWVDGGGVQPRCGTVPRPDQLDHYVVSAAAWTTADDSPPPMSEVTATTAGAPSSVMQGTTIRYQVILSPHGTALDPCPPFREQLLSADGAGTPYATHYYRLDCNAIADVDASTFRLDMELTMPGDVPPGDYVLDWSTPIPGFRDDSSPTIEVTAAPPPCEQQQLDITRGRSGAGTGHYYHVVLLTNVSPDACSLRGFPGVQFVDEAGNPLPTQPEHDTTRPYETVVLEAHGGVASFLLSGTDFKPPAGAEPCPATKGVLIIAPNLVDQVLVPGVGMNCTDGSIRVYPVVAGQRGQP